MERPCDSPSVCSDDTNGADVASLRFVYCKMAEEFSRMDEEMKALKSNMQCLNDELKQLLVEKTSNLTQVASLKVQIDSIAQQERSLVCSLNNTRLNIKRDGEFESSLNENLRALRLSDSEKMSNCNQNIKKYIGTMKQLKDSYAELPWVKEKNKRLIEIQIRRIFSARFEQLSKDVIARNKLMSQIDYKRRNVEIIKLAKLMVEWKTASLKGSHISSSIKTAQETVTFLERRKEELTGKIAAKTRNIIHDIVAGSGESRHSLPQNQPAKEAPSLRELVGFRKLQKVSENTVLQPWSIKGKGLSVYIAPTVVAKPAQLDEADFSLGQMANETVASPRHSELHEKMEVVSTDVPTQTGTKSLEREEKRNELDKASTLAASKKQTEQSPTHAVAKHTQSLRAILKPPPSLGMKPFSPPQPEIQKIASIPDISPKNKTSANSSSDPGEVVPSRTEKSTLEKSPLSGSKRNNSPSLPSPPHEVFEPSRGARQENFESEILNGRSDEIENRLLPVSNTVESSDSDVSGCSEAKIPKVVPTSILPTKPNQQLKPARLPNKHEQLGHSSRKFKKVSFQANGSKNVVPDVAGPQISSTSSEKNQTHATQNDTAPKPSKGENSPVIPTTTPKAPSEVASYSQVNDVFDACFGDIFGGGVLSQPLAGSSVPTVDTGADFFSFAKVNQSDVDKPLNDFFNFF